MDDTLSVGQGKTGRGAVERVSLTELSAPAELRILQFLAGSTVKGGPSPADVADLYTSPEIVADAKATAFLDQRYVHGTLPEDWREIQERLTSVFQAAPPGVTGAALLVHLRHAEAGAAQPRSIFDDPDDIEDVLDDRLAIILDRAPLLVELSDDGRRAIERHIVADVMNYGVPPIRVMQLRSWLFEGGDERALQFFDWPSETGERPFDWDRLRDRALRIRGTLEQRGKDPVELLARAEQAHPDLDAETLLSLLADPASR